MIVFPCLCVLCRLTGFFYSCSVRGIWRCSDDCNCITEARQVERMFVIVRGKEEAATSLRVGRVPVGTLSHLSTRREAVIPYPHTLEASLPSHGFPRGLTTERFADVAQPHHTHIPPHSQRRKGSRKGRAGWILACQLKCGPL